MEMPSGTTPSPRPPARGHLSRVFRAFSYRDYRLLWSGAFTSSVGTWMQEVAQNWLVLQLTNSPFWLGLDAALGDAPQLVFSLIAGVYADRLDRRKILLASQVIQMANAFILAALVFTHHVHVWHILTLSFLTGTAQSFGAPAYQSIVPNLVHRDDVPNAVALQSIQFNLARVIGPVVAGFAFVSLGAAGCFSLNGVSYLAPIAALLLLRTQFRGRVGPERVLDSLKSGLRYVASGRAMRELVVLAFATSFLAFPLTTLLPVFAKNIFVIGAAGYSRLLAVFGAGAVLGALGVASLGNFRRKGLTAIGTQLLFAGCMAGFAFSHSLALSMSLLFVAGLAMVSLFSVFMALVQLNVDDAFRGRVVSVYMLAFRGAMPLGNLVAGALAARLSAPTTLAANAVVLALVAVFFLSRPSGTVVKL
jgi:MFS family permease